VAVGAAEVDQAAFGQQVQAAAGGLEGVAVDLRLDGVALDAAGGDFVGSTSVTMTRAP
jgi:hypothetical protein